MMHVYLWLTNPSCTFLAMIKSCPLPRLKSAVDIVDYRWSDVNEAPSTSGWMNYRHRNQQSLPGERVMAASGLC